MMLPRRRICRRASDPRCPAGISWRWLIPINYEEVDEAFLKQTGKLYKRKCKKCHGENGDGKGSKAEFFIIKPAAFSTPGYLAKRKDGQLFWIMMNGSEGTEMEPVGPYSDVGLSEENLWQLIVYLRRTFTH